SRIPILSLNQRNNTLEQLYLSVVRGEQPPELVSEPNKGMFAPPGHPDAAPEAPTIRPSTGDTLLRELLGRESDRRPADTEE
ncbi:MAG TPA: hypothetical protein VFX76_19740, partial [Roseiflexaceae bacterium]|nr:hypothetical protein [Roseiflexaceae bacterium]